MEIHRPNEIAVNFMAAKLTKPKPKPKVQEQTFEEVKYLKRLIEGATPVCIRLKNNEEVTGVIEFYDTSFIRVTRLGNPNLFLFKHDIKYLYEVPAVK